MSKLSRNILYNLSGQLLLASLGFVAVKYIFKQLGGDALGIIYFVVAVNAALGSVMGMGMNETTVREVSSHLKSEPEYVRKLLRMEGMFYWGAYVILAACLYLAAPWLVHEWINLKTLDPHTAIRVMRLLGIAGFLALPRSFYVSILRGLERMEFNNIIDVSASAAQQIGTLVILFTGGGLLYVVYWMAACYGFAILAYVPTCAHFFSWGAMLPGFVSGVISRNISYTSHMAMISLLAMIHMQSDKAIVSKLLPLTLFGLYTVAYGAVSKAATLTGAVFQGSFPHLSGLYNAHDRAAMMTQYRKLQDLVCFATVPLFAALIFAEKPLFQLLFNAAAARTLLLPVAFLCVGFFMNGALTIPYAVSLAVGRPDIASRSNLYAVFIVLPTSVVLVYYFGLSGAALSWICYHIYAYSYALPRICSECLECHTRAWLCRALKIIALACLTYGVAWSVSCLTMQRSIVTLSVAYLLSTVAFCTISYKMLGVELRNTLQTFFRGLRIRFGEGIIAHL